VRVALKFGYDGRKFSGSQRQPGKRTVEGEIISTLEEFTEFENFKSAGRTDAGVSALGAVISFDTKFPVEKLVRSLNARVKDIWFYGYKIVKEDFNPRHALQRHYRYYLRENRQNYDILKEVALLFVGEHDFRNFSKYDGKTQVRKIDRIEIGKKDIFYTIDFYAESFLWNQIRRIVSAMDKVSRGLVDFSEIKDALYAKERKDFGLAIPEALVLVDVKYDFEFEKDKNQNEIAIRKIEENLHNAKLYSEFIEEMRRCFD